MESFPIWAVRSKNKLFRFFVFVCLLLSKFVLFRQKENSPKLNSVLCEHNTKYPHYLVVVTGTLFATFICVTGRFCETIFFSFKTLFCSFSLRMILFDWDLFFLFACYLGFFFVFVLLNGKSSQFSGSKGPNKTQNATKTCKINWLMHEFFTNDTHLENKSTIN